MIRLAALEAYAFRFPIEKPIAVAFGVFRDRPLVLVRAVDEDGTEGWGEAWCNWPAVGAEHRARLVADFGPTLLGHEFEGPAAAFTHLTQITEVLVLQTGEVGPVAQAIAGIDIALWDLDARKRGLPLYRRFREDAVLTVPVYATGLNPDGPEAFADAQQTRGHRAFKLKIGFGRDLDLRNMGALRTTLGNEAVLMVDANQSLDGAAALDMACAAADHGMRWLEEPLRVDAPAADWADLARASPVPLAGGENLRGADLDGAVQGAVLRVIQPDITKWGGITGNLGVARGAVAAGKPFCPHVFAGGVAHLVSLHLLAAVGGDGLLEFDCHPNPGRERILGDLLPVCEGRVPVPQGAGLGATPDLASLEAHLSWP